MSSPPFGSAQGTLRRGGHQVYLNFRVLFYSRADTGGKNINSGFPYCSFRLFYNLINFCWRMKKVKSKKNKTKISLIIFSILVLSAGPSFSLSIIEKFKIDPVFVLEIYWGWDEDYIC